MFILVLSGQSVLHDLSITMLFSLYSCGSSFPRRDGFPFSYLGKSLDLDGPSEFSLCHLLWCQIQEVFKLAN